MTLTILVLVIWLIGMVLTGMGVIWYEVRVAYRTDVEYEVVVVVSLFWFIILPGLAITIGVTKLIDKWERYLRNN